MQNNNGSNPQEMGISSNYANNGAPARASTDITMYSTNPNHLYKQQANTESPMGQHGAMHHNKDNIIGTMHQNHNQQGLHLASSGANSRQGN